MNIGIIRDNLLQLMMPSVSFEECMPSRPPDQEKFHRKSARDKLMDFLARRDHSELELRQKLGRDYPTDEVDMAIELARTRGWLLAPEALAERVTEQLNRKNKGTRYIQKFLKLRGLPFLARDSEQELEKARTLTKSKFGHDAPYSYEEQKKNRSLPRQSWIRRRNDQESDV